MSKEGTSSTTTSGGIGFSGLLTIVFIVLKLTGYIEWSWWWVLSPVLIGIAGAIVATIVGVVILILVEYFS